MISSLQLNYTSPNHVFSLKPDIGSVTWLSSGQVFQCAAMAEAMLDSRLSRKYVLPFTVAVPYLTALATELSLNNVMMMRLMTTGAKYRETPWAAHRDELIKMIDNLISGEQTLVDNSGQIISGRSDVGEVYTTTMNYEPTFSEINVADWGADPDKIEAEYLKRDMFYLDVLK